MERRESSYTVGGNISYHNRYGEQYAGSLKTKYRITIGSRNATPGHLFGEKHNSKRWMNPNVYCSTICSLQHYLAKTWKQPKYPTTKKRIKMWGECVCVCVCVCVYIFIYFL